jgi:hypothetical protein
MFTLWIPMMTKSRFPHNIEQAFELQSLVDGTVTDTCAREPDYFSCCLVDSRLRFL